MAQNARPNADIVDGGWVKSSDGTNVDLFSMIDEVAADDTDFVRTANAPANDAMAVHLSDVEDPQSSTGHTLSWRHSKNSAGGGQIDLTVQLRQGYTGEGAQGTLIAGVARTNIPETWTADSFTLSAAEADAITNYADLQLRLVANQV